MPIKHVERIEAEEEVDSLRAQGKLLGSSDIFIPVREISHISEQPRRVTESIAWSLCKRRRVELPGLAKDPASSMESSETYARHYIRTRIQTVTQVAGCRFAREDAGTPVGFFYPKQRSTEISVDVADGPSTYYGVGACDLPVLRKVKIGPDTRLLLADLDSQPRSAQMRIVAASCRVRDEQASENRLTFRADGVADTEAFVRIQTARRVRQVLIGGAVQPTGSLSEDSGTLLIQFPNSVDPIQVEIDSE